MRYFLICASLIACSYAAQDPQQHDPVIPPNTTGHEPGMRLPNGKLQSHEILKADYEKSLKDAERLVELSQSLEADMRKETSQVMSLSDLKKLDEIEKITKRIRGRIRHF